MADPVVTTDALRKVYGETVAVDGVSLEIERGEIYALLGPNGAGKTTLVELLECLREPTSGTATVCGHDLSDRDAIAALTGVVPQSFHTFERLTVRENVALVASTDDDPLDVDEVLDRLDLSEQADTRFGALSGGYRRRTGVAMALVGDPAVVFLDEPTTGLDPAARRAMWDQIDALPETGTTVVLTTHYMDEVEALADRVAILLDGSIEAIDTPEGLIEQYAGTVSVVVRGDDRPIAEDIEATLDKAAETTVRTEDGDLVGTFDDRDTAQQAYADLIDEAPDRAIDLVSAGMEEVFLSLAGRRLDPAGELS